MTKLQKAGKKHHNWGGVRIGQTGRPRKPEADKLIPTSVGFTAAQVAKLTGHALNQQTSMAEVVRSAVDALPDPKETP